MLCGMCNVYEYSGSYSEFMIKFISDEMKWPISVHFYAQSVYKRKVII